MRARFGLAPGRGAQPPAQDDLGYVGREFRVYEYMQIGFAVRFYATLHERWDAEVLARALKTAALEERFDVRRMKRAYKRALVLAFALAASPRVLVIEGAEEFDEPGARALLESAVAAVPSVIVTYAPDAAIDRAWFDDVLEASDVRLPEVGAAGASATTAALGTSQTLRAYEALATGGSLGSSESRGASEALGTAEPVSFSGSTGSSDSAASHGTSGSPGSLDTSGPFVTP